MSTTNKLTLGDDLRTLQAGIKANLTDVQTLIVGGVSYTPVALEAKIDTYLAAQTAALNATNAFHSAVAAQKVSDADARVFRSQMQGYVISRYGKTNPIVSQFSFKPTAAKKTTTAVKAVAVLKLKATRAARNTMGKKQKLKITGTVDPSIAEMLAGGTSSGSAPVMAPAHAVSTPVALSAPAEGAAMATPGHAPAPGDVHNP
jgi:hypothetical protein